MKKTLALALALLLALSSVAMAEGHRPTVYVIEKERVAKVIRPLLPRDEYVVALDNLPHWNGLPNVTFKNGRLTVGGNTLMIMDGTMPMAQELRFLLLVADMFPDVCKTEEEARTFVASMLAPYYPQGFANDDEMEAAWRELMRAIYAWFYAQCPDLWAYQTETVLSWYDHMGYTDLMTASAEQGGMDTTGTTSGGMPDDTGTPGSDTTDTTASGSGTPGTTDTTTSGSDTPGTTDTTTSGSDTPSTTDTTASGSDTPSTTDTTASGSDTTDTTGTTASGSGTTGTTGTTDTTASGSDTPGTTDTTASGSDTTTTTDTPTGDPQPGQGPGSTADTDPAPDEDDVPIWIKWPPISIDAICDPPPSDDALPPPAVVVIEVPAPPVETILIEIPDPPEIVTIEIITLDESVSQALIDQINEGSFPIRGSTKSAASIKQPPQWIHANEAERYADLWSLYLTHQIDTLELLQTAEVTLSGYTLDAILPFQSSRLNTDASTCANTLMTAGKSTVSANGAYFGTAFIRDGTNVTGLLDGQRVITNFYLNDAERQAAQNDTKPVEAPPPPPQSGNDAPPISDWEPTPIRPLLDPGHSADPEPDPDPGNPDDKEYI